MSFFVDVLIFCASFIREMGGKKKEKAKAEVRTVSDDRVKKRKYQTIPVSTKREMKVLKQQGFKLPEVRKLLNLPHLPRQTFFDITKRNYSDDVASRDYNSSYKSTDQPIVHLRKRKYQFTIESLSLGSRMKKLML